MARIYLRAIIEQVCRGGKFWCHLLDNNTHKVNVYVSGNMRLNGITLCAGDEVTVELSPYDLHRGRVIWRQDRNI